MCRMTFTLEVGQSARSRARKEVSTKYLSSRALDEFPDPLAVVDFEVVHYHNLPVLEGGCQEALDLEVPNAGPSVAPSQRSSPHLRLRCSISR